MFQTNTEYMSDKARAERVIRKFLNITLGELMTAQNRKCIEFITAELVARGGHPKRLMKYATYMEFVRMIDGVGGNPDYDWYDHNSYDEQLTYHKMLAKALLDSGKTLIPVRLFMALPLKAFYTGLSSMSGREVLLREFERIRGCCKYSDDYTIRDFLADKFSEGSKAWLPITPIQDYEENMRAAHIDMGKVLVYSFCTAFPRLNPEASLSKERLVYDSHMNRVREAGKENRQR